jgi:ATP-dependent RNA helicase DeaD
MTEFKKLNLDIDVLKAIELLKFKEATEVQIKSIPKILVGKNLIVQSATGTGKTIAFLSSTISKIKPKKEAQILVITPTRELAIQILDESIKLSKFKRTFSSAIYGGDSISRQASELKNADIVIGTPGRLIDQIKRKNLKLHTIKSVILDEADRMCEMGFFEDITTIIDKTPEEKQILLFSATITKDVEKLKRKYIKKYETIKIDSHVDPLKLKQEYYVVKENNKMSLIIDLIKKHIDKKSVIFCNTRSEVDLIHHNLKNNNIECYKLHGGLEQKTRTNTISKFHKHQTAVLISTDVSARGIHIDNLEYIYNYDIPKEATQYVHRIGRTARAGKDGLAITLISKKFLETFKKMCNHFGFKPIEKELPDFKIINISKPERTNNRQKYSESKVKTDRIKRDVFKKKEFYKPKQFSHNFLEDITNKENKFKSRNQDFRDKPKDFKSRRRDLINTSNSNDRNFKSEKDSANYKKRIADKKEMYKKQKLQRYKK